ncbi:MAG: septum formation initiator family protein [Herpetosiphonaceae bacterium]|nr:septum formation initiator family protein [Herpetosiphonaceae bacterium]
MAPKRQLRMPKIRPPTLPRPERIQRSSLQLITWGLAAFAIYLMVLFSGMVVQEYRMQQQIALRASENAQREQEQRNLQDRLAYVRSDAAIEVLARDRLDMARPNETVLQLNIVDPAPTTGPNPPAPVVAVVPHESVPNWRRWWNILFGS